MKRSGCVIIFAVFLLCASLLSAQSNPNEEQGLKPYDSWHGGDLDSVSMTNGGLVLHIPLASFPQRGNLDLGFMIRYSSKAANSRILSNRSSNRRKISPSKSQDHYVWKARKT